MVVTILALATPPWSHATMDAAVAGEPGFHAPVASLLLATPTSAGSVHGASDRHAWHHPSVHGLPACDGNVTTARTAPFGHPRHAQDWFARRNLEGG